MLGHGSLSTWRQTRRQLLSCDRSVHPSVDRAMVRVRPGLEGYLVGPRVLGDGIRRKWGRAGLPCHVVAIGGRCPGERYLACRHCVRRRTKEVVAYCDIRRTATAARRVAASRKYADGNHRRCQTWERHRAPGLELTSQRASRTPGSGNRSGCCFDCRRLVSSGAPALRRRRPGVAR